MQASARLTGQTLGLQPGDVALVCLNIHYVAGSMMLVRGLELALPMTIIEPVSNPLADFGPDIHFAFTALVPLQLQTILSTDDERQVAMLNAMKAILVGGAATSPVLEQALQVIRAPIYATYGMTETVSHIALRRLNGPAASDLFSALDGVKLGVDTRNCLHITSAATNFERVQTNDVVDLVDPMHFRLRGRADRIINSGGVKIQPELVEQIIQESFAQLGAIPRFFVAGLPDEKLGQRVVVVCERITLPDAQWVAMQAVVRERLGPYAVPKEWLRVPQFTETPTGKVDQRAILAGIR